MQQFTVWSLKYDSIFVGLVNRSPSSDDQQNNKLLAMMNEMCFQNTSHVLIMGDMNYAEIDWENQACNTSTDHHAYKFLEKFRDCFLYQHVNEPTHYRGLQKANK